MSSPARNTPLLLLPLPHHPGDANLQHLHGLVPVLHRRHSRLTTVAFTSSTGWKQVSFSFTPTSTLASMNNRFVVSLNGATVAGQMIEFAMLCLPADVQEAGKWDVVGYLQYA
ncbi:hypothetical protein C8R44DRAFT_876512 [Mycena epipterygia]|nr:hypothetical protein C8R44DRAFT_876512 [Mycena epipterygia]